MNLEGVAPSAVELIDDLIGLVLRIERRLRLTATPKGRAECAATLADATTLIVALARMALSPESAQCVTALRRHTKALSKRLAEEPVAQPRPLRPPSQAMRILLVEDSSDNRIVFEAMFVGSPHLVELVPDGESALARFSMSTFDLVLMDLHLPGMSGYDATRALRQHEREHGAGRTSVVALTACVLATELRAALEAGCDGFIGKPVGRRDLLIAVERYGSCVCLSGPCDA